MAKTLSKTGVTTGNTVEAFHVTQSVDAFTALDAYDISLSGSLDVEGPLTNNSAIISGSFSGSYEGDGSGLTGVTGEWDGSHVGNANITGSLTITGTFNGVGSGITGVISSSYATSASYVNSSSYAVTTTSASHAIITDSLNTLNQDVIITGSIRMNTGGITKTIRTYDPDSFSTPISNNDYYLIVSKSSGVTIDSVDLPPTPLMGQEMVFLHHPDGNNFQLSGSGNTLNGSNLSPSLTPNQSRSICTYDGAGDWYVSYNN